LGALPDRPTHSRHHRWSAVGTEGVLHMSLSDDLVRLSELYASGALSADEYDRAKQQLLHASSGPAASAPPASIPTPVAAYPAAANPAAFAQPPHNPFPSPAQPWAPNGQPAVSAADSWVDPHYQQKFAQIEGQGGSFMALWNWPAFLFGAFWYLSKGMWAKALLIVVVVFATGGFLGIPIWIYAGIAGTYDFYLLKRRQKQLW
jgi:hypothetical protein